MAASVDVSRIPDGGMTVAFELTNLPLAGQTQANFTQTFALTRSKPPVTVVALTEADQAAVQAQETCPVMGTRLGDHGRPIKVLVGGQAVYLCCKGCLGRVKADPKPFAAKAAQLRGER